MRKSKTIKKRGSGMASRLKNVGRKVSKRGKTVKRKVSKRGKIVKRKVSKKGKTVGRKVSKKGKTVKRKVSKKRSKKGGKARSTMKKKIRTAAPGNVTRVVLYYADWCPHCTMYKPVWKSIKKQFSGMKGIKFEEYESEFKFKSGPNEGKSPCKMAQIQGYPTVKILKGPGHKKGGEYSGDRDQALRATLEKL